MTGKTLAIDGLGGLPEFTIRNWIDKNGGDSKSVKFVELTFSQMLPALKAGRVDASEMNSAFDPLIGKPNDTVHLIGSSYAALAPIFLASAWFSTKEWIEKNPDTTKTFMTVMEESAIWTNTHHHESAVLLSPHIKRPAEMIEKAPRVMYGVEMAPEIVQPLINLAAKYVMLKSAFPARDIISALALK